MYRALINSQMYFFVSLKRRIPKSREKRKEKTDDDVISIQLKRITLKKLLEFRSNELFVKPYSSFSISVNDI